MQSIDVGPWIGSLMIIAGLSITIAMAKYNARLHKRERSEIKAKSKG